MTQNPIVGFGILGIFRPVTQPLSTLVWKAWRPETMGDVLNMHFLEVLASPHALETCYGAFLQSLPMGEDTQVFL